MTLAWCWWRWTRIPLPSTGATSATPSRSTGRRICSTRCAATSWTGPGFEAMLSQRGVSNDDTVVLYGGNNNWFAAYAYWYFRLYGHDKVKLLDGGRKKWELDSRELMTDVPKRPATGYAASDQDTSIRAFRDEVLAAIGKVNLVDVRSPDEFSGKLLAPAHLPQEQAQRAGHIPAAKNVPWSRRPTTTAPSRTTTSSAGFTAARAWTSPRTPSRTAGSASAARTPGSCCTSCSASTCAELRRFMDRVRYARRSPDREERLNSDDLYPALPGVPVAGLLRRG